MQEYKIQKIFNLLHIGTEKDRQCILNQGVIEFNKDKDPNKFEIIFSHNTDDLDQETSERGN